jgi:hypothetical protein
MANQDFFPIPKTSLPFTLSPSIHKFDDEFIYSGLSAVRQAHRPELIEGLGEH